MTDVSISLRAKRKRGRPRKDSNLCREGSLQSPENSTLIRTQRVEVMYPTPDSTKKPQAVDKNPKDGAVDGMVGSMVYGVVEGSFDAGYLISVRIGNNHTPFRGVVFLPRKIVPVTAATDIVPQAKMHHRREIPFPVYDNLSQASGFSPQPVSKQAVLRPTLPSMPLSVNPFSSSNQSSFMATAPEAMMLRTGSCSNMGGKITVPTSPDAGVGKQFSYVHPTGSLRMVEEDEVMQTFEVSTSSGGSKNNAAAGGDNQKPQDHGKAVEAELGTSMLAHNKLQGSSGSNVQLHHGLMEDMPPSAFGIQQDEMMCSEMEQCRKYVHTSTIETQQNVSQMYVAPQSHSVPGEPLAARTELRPTNNLYYNELRSPDVNSHQNLLTNQSQSGNFVDSISKSPNLKLDLAFTAHEQKPLPPEQQASADTNYSVHNGTKNQSLGYHQALVAGNPLLLPPDLIGEPLEFMMEKLKSSPTGKTPDETNLEQESRVVEAGERFHGADAMSNAEIEASPSASYKLELATPQSALNIRPGTQTNSSAGCITDMDFALSDAIQPAESQNHRSLSSENIA